MIRYRCLYTASLTDPGHHALSIRDAVIHICSTDPMSSQGPGRRLRVHRHSDDSGHDQSRFLPTSEANGFAFLAEHKVVAHSPSVVFALRLFDLRAFSSFRLLLP